MVCLACIGLGRPSSRPAGGGRVFGPGAIDGRDPTSTPLVHTCSIAVRPTPGRVQDAGHVPARSIRHVDATVLVADIVNHTMMLGILGQADGAFLTHAVLSTLERVVIDHEGLVDARMGDGVLAVFPTGEPSHGAAERALSCASASFLAIESLATQANLDLQLRIGVATGPVMRGRFGAANGGSTTVVGTTANLAARLQSVADAGEVVACNATVSRLGSLAAAWQVTRKDDLHLKNLPTVTSAWTVRRRSSPGASNAHEPTSIASDLRSTAHALVSARIRSACRVAAHTGRVIEVQVHGSSRAVSDCLRSVTACASSDATESITPSIVTIDASTHGKAFWEPWLALVYGEQRAHAGSRVPIVSEMDDPRTATRYPLDDVATETVDAWCTAITWAARASAHPVIVLVSTFAVDAATAALLDRLRHQLIPIVIVRATSGRRRRLGPFDVALRDEGPAGYVVSEITPSLFAPLGEVESVDAPSNAVVSSGALDRLADVPPLDAAAVGDRSSPRGHRSSHVRDLVDIVAVEWFGARLDMLIDLVGTSADRLAGMLADDERFVVVDASAFDDWPDVRSHGVPGGVPIVVLRSPSERRGVLSAMDSDVRRRHHARIALWRKRHLADGTSLATALHFDAAGDAIAAFEHGWNAANALSTAKRTNEADEVRRWCSTRNVPPELVASSVDRLDVARRMPWHARVVSTSRRSDAWTQTKSPSNPVDAPDQRTMTSNGGHVHVPPSDQAWQTVFRFPVHDRYVSTVSTIEIDRVDRPRRGQPRTA